MILFAFLQERQKILSILLILSNVLQGPQGGPKWTSYSTSIKSACPAVRPYKLKMTFVFM